MTETTDKVSGESLKVGLIVNERFRSDGGQGDYRSECGIAHDQESKETVRLFRSSITAGDSDTATLERRVSFGPLCSQERRTNSFRWAFQQ